MKNFKYIVTKHLWLFFLSISILLCSDVMSMKPSQLNFLEREIFICGVNQSGVKNMLKTLKMFEMLYLLGYITKLEQIIEENVTQPEQKSNESIIVHNAQNLVITLKFDRYRIPKNDDKGDGKDKCEDNSKVLHKMIIEAIRVNEEKHAALVETLKQCGHLVPPICNNCLGDYTRYWKDDSWIECVTTFKHLDLLQDVMCEIVEIERKKQINPNSFSKKSTRLKLT